MTFQLRDYLQLVSPFWSNVHISEANDCWEWTRSLFAGGYGRVTSKGKVTGAHRIAYELVYGPIPQGLQVLHSCDNRKCCNPRHLSVGTNLDNVKDKVSRGRQTSGSRNGMSKLTEEQVGRIIVDSRTQLQIATEYGISQSMVSKIKLRRSWKNQK